MKLAQASAGFSVAEPEEEDDPPTSAEQLATPSSDITLPSANANPWGIWSDSSTIRVADRIDDKLYAYTLADGTRQTDREFALHSDNGTPRGIWSDGTTIWVADSDDNELYAYALDGGTRQAAKEFNLHSGNRNSVGIWSDGTTIWVTDFFADKLYAYALDGGTRQAAKEFNLHGDNSASRGIWSNGTTIWVADAIDNKLYAYALDDGTRQADREFNLHSDNAGVQGLWSNGTTIWVADHTDRKLYAYALPQLQPPTLTALTVSPGTLTPDFSSGTTEYTVPDVPHSGSRITITATAGTGATVSYEDGSGDTLTDVDSTTDGDQFDLAVGENVIKVKVTKGSLSRTYTLAVSRQAAAQTDITLHEDNADPTSMTSDGTTLWVTDRIDDKLYAYALADGTRQDGTGGTTDKEFDLHTDNGEPRGIWTDGTNLWAANWNDGNIYVYALADGTRQDGTGGTTDKEFSLHPRLNKWPDSIWADGTTMWVVDIINLSILAYALADGTNQNGSEDNGSTNKQFLPHSSNSEVGGIWADGTTMWVADIIDDKLYAYLYTDVPGRFGQHFAPRQDGTGGTTNKEFQLRAENGQPLSIWSDGTTMWVLDPEDSKIYAYPLLDEYPQSPPGPKLTELSVNPGTLLPSFDSDTLEYTVIDVPRRESNWITVIATAESGASVSYEDGFNVPITDINPTMLGDQLPLPSLSQDFNYIRITVSKDGLSRVYDLTVTYVSREAAGPTSFDLHPDNSNARGIWSDGTTMWVADSAYFEGRPYSEERASKLYAYALADGTRQDGTGGTVNKEFDLDSNSIYPIGIWSDYRTMWVGDYYGGRVYAYALGDGTRQDGIANEDKDKEIDPGPHAGNGAVSGIWSNGVTMWVADPDDDKIYAYSLADGRRQDGAPYAYIIDGIRYRFDGRLYDENAVNQEFDLHSDNSSPIGISSIDVTMLVLDDEDARLYAYARADGTRQDGTGGADDWEFNLHDDNGNPVGIWSSNEKMWVLDGDDGKVYSYTFPVPPMLTGLSVSPGTLTPAFDSKTRDYAVPDVPHASGRITVTATAEGRARVSYEDGSGNSLTDADADAAGDQFDLEVGENVIRIRVTEGEVSRTYALAVSRAYHPSLSPPYRFTWSNGVHYHNCQLGPEDNPYWEFYLSTDSSTTRLVQPSDLRRSGHDDCSATVRIPLSYFPLGSCDLNADNLCITVRHTELRVDHNTGGYAPSFSRPAVVELIPASTDATLRALALSGVDFGAFASTTTEYAASVAHAVAETTVTPAVSDYRAAYAVKLGGVADADGTVPLAEGENVIAVKVTAEDGETAQTYSVTVTRAAPLAAPGRPTGVVPEPGTVTLGWEDVDGATGYQVGLWSQPNLVPLPSDDMPGVAVQMDGSSARLTGLPAEWSHYWLKVRASNGGGASGWSDWLALENS